MTKLSTLIVEDGRSFRERMTDLLRKERIFDVNAVDSVARGVQEIRANRFDLLAADFKFDGQNTGYLLFEPALESNPDIGIVVISKYPVEKETASAGAHGFIPKSTCDEKPAECVQKLRKVLESRLLSRLAKELRSQDARRAFLTLPRRAGNSLSPPAKGAHRCHHILEKLRTLDPTLVGVEALRNQIISDKIFEPGVAFLLAFVSSCPPVSTDALELHLSPPPDWLAREVGFLADCGLVRRERGDISITEEGLQVLRSLGLQDD